MIKKIWVITMFPEFFNSLKDAGVVGQSLSGKRGPGIELNSILLRDFHPNGHNGVDDTPYGGGAGMVLRADVLKEALLNGVVKEGSYGEDWREKLHIIAPGPRGRKWDFSFAKDFAQKKIQDTNKDLVFICGRYEGIDERFIENYVDEHISIGDFILSGGEIAVMTILDSALRFIPGVLKNEESPLEESFGSELLEFPHYTRPPVFEDLEVPKVLISGHHGKIKEYRNEKRLEMTKKYRPDLLKAKKEK